MNRPRQRHLRSLRGFSLMEVMIAVTLLAVIGAALASSLTTSITSKEIIEDTSGRYHVVRQAMTRMVDEISMAYLSAHNQAPTLRVKTGFLGERDELQFTAFGHIPRVEDAREGDTRELGFFLGRDERTGNQAIIRRIQTNPDDEFDDGGREQTLLPDATSLEFEYFDPQTEEWTDKWDNEGTVTRDRLPSRVRITFGALMASGEEQLFTTQTKIWLQKPWAFRN